MQDLLIIPKLEAVAAAWKSVLKLVSVGETSAVEEDATINSNRNAAPFLSVLPDIGEMNLTF